MGLVDLIMVVPLLHSTGELNCLFYVSIAYFASFLSVLAPKCVKFNMSGVGLLFFLPFIFLLLSGYGVYSSVYTLLSYNNIKAHKSAKFSLTHLTFDPYCQVMFLLALQRCKIMDLPVWSIVMLSAAEAMETS